MGTSSEGPVAGRLQIVCSRIRRKIQGLATPEDHPIYNMHAFRRPLTPYRREQAARVDGVHGSVFGIINFCDNSCSLGDQGLVVFTPLQGAVDQLRNDDLAFSPVANGEVI